MADIIRKMTVEKGFDPRDFVLSPSAARDRRTRACRPGARRAEGRDPQKEIASTWCAFGAAAADILHVYEQVDIQMSPFEAIA